MCIMCLCVLILISLATSLSFASLPVNGVSDCGSDQWQCKNGTCISKNKLCDQVSDCSDNSDETSPICRKRAIANSGICVLPPHPEHGRYDVEDIPDARPGQAYPSFVLTVRCRRGFGVMDLFGDGSGIQKVYCVNGKWYQNMPRCVRFCKLDPDPSIRYMCYTPGTGVTVCRNYVSPGTVVEPACNSPIYYSSEVLQNMKCISGVWTDYARCKVECGRITPSGKPLLIGGKEAKHGELPWHAAIYRRVSEVFTQICSGSLVSNNVVISAAHCFWKDVIKLLPASQFGVAVGKLHREWDSEEDVFAQKSYVKEIKIEKLYDGVAANFQEDIAILILSTPFNYTTYIRPVCLDFNMNFENLQLQHGALGKVAGWGLTAPNGPPSESLKVVSLPFIDEDTCINSLPDTFRGYITGDKFCAGYTHGTAVCHGDSGGGLAFPSQELGRDRYYLRGIVSTAPKDDNKLCNDNAYTTFTKITRHQNLIIDALAESNKKICPLYSFQCADGTCVDPGADCNGRQDCADGSDESDDLCRVGPLPESLALAESNKKICPLYSFQCADGTCVDPGADCNGRQDCADGSDESDDLCRVGPLPESLKPTQSSAINSDCGRIAEEVKRGPTNLNGNTYGKGDTPWLAAVYENMQNTLTYLCAGTLISKRHVVTVAHAFGQNTIASLVDSIVVKLGSSNLEAWAENSVITRKLVSINLIESFNISSLADDLAILTLNRQVKFTAYIRPACLWDGRKFPGDSGVFAGWGKERELKFGEPHVMRLKIVSTAVCRASNKNFEYVTSEKTFCGKGVKNGTNPCAGDAGGGLYLLDGDQWWLRGVVFLALPPRSGEELCNLNEYAVFTDVSQYLPWIKSVLSNNL